MLRRIDPRPSKARRILRWIGAFLLTSGQRLLNGLLYLGLGVILFFGWPLVVAVLYFNERHLGRPPYNWHELDNNALVDLWNERESVRSTPSLLEKTVVELSGRGAQAEVVPSLSRLINLALLQKTLAAEIDRRRITPERLRQRVCKEAKNELAEIEAGIEVVKAAKLNIHTAFEPAYRAAYNAITEQFTIPRRHRVLRNVLFLLALPTTLFVVVLSFAVTLALFDIKITYWAASALIRGAVIAYTFNTFIAAAAFLGRGDLLGQQLRFLEELNEQLIRERSRAQAAVESYTKLRRELLETVRRILVPWLMVRVRRAPLLSVKKSDLEAKLHTKSPEESPVNNNLASGLIESVGDARLNNGENLRAAPLRISHTRERHYAFLCHAIEDKEQVRDIYKFLSERDLDPWMDEKKLIGGQDWWEEIEMAIEASVAFVVCLSRRSAEKVGIVQTEIHKALRVADRQPFGAIFVIPVMLEECEIPRQLAKWHCIMLYGEGGMEQLCEAISAAKTAADKRDQRIYDR
ncbi:MAG TPA: toll/interleukin-1 receptor domain-containing protein [Longimicrobium sp.]